MAYATSREEQFIASDSTLEGAVEVLRRGEVVVYPTETYYGLGADCSCRAALARLFELKQRETGKPVALIAADSEMALSLAGKVAGQARWLADAFWPGPLTLVMPAREEVSRELLGPEGGVGVRVSSHPVARALATRLGRPITATSANRAGGRPAVTVAEARAIFGKEIRVYLDGGRLAGGAPSTVVSFDERGMHIVRKGAISEYQLIAALSQGRPSDERR